MTSLDRRYRRLLWAYPGSYRRRHGAEITTTMLEMAEAGERVPRWPVLLGGLRQRFRLPAGRPLAWLGALLATALMAAAGAAAGSWLSTAFQPAMPDKTAVLQLNKQIAAADGAQNWQLHQSPWSGTTAFAETPIPTDWSAEPAVQRLQADGWHTAPVHADKFHAEQSDPDGATRIPATGYTIDASRDGIGLQATVIIIPGRHANAWLQVWQAPTPALLPLTAAGLVLGAILGWLLAAATAYRIRTTGRITQRGVSALNGAAMLLLALPAAAILANAQRSLADHGDFAPAYAAHHVFAPGPFYPFGPSWLILALGIAGLLTAAAALTLTHTRRAPQAQHIIA